MSRTLYDKYGGFAQINRVVLGFYDALLDNERLAPFFDGVDMPRLIDHQTQLVASLFGGPALVDDTMVRHGHARLSIGDGDFDEMLVVFADTLRTSGIGEADAAMVIAAFETRRPLVVKAVS